MINNYDKEFLNVFNEYYPFERYILKNPKPIGNLFDEALLEEIFIPQTEIKPILSDDGSELISFTSIDKDEIYIKIKTAAGVIRLGYFDFNQAIRENIRNIIIDDFGQYEWEGLFVDQENLGKLQEILLEQKYLIEQKYTLCNIKNTIRTILTK